MNVCPRCCKNTNGVHTCTPTDAWREIERQRDELLAALKRLDWLIAGDQIGSSDVEAIRAAIASVEGQS